MQRRYFFTYIFLMFLGTFFVVSGVSATTFEVSIMGTRAFSPSSISITTGDTVRWTATDNGDQVSSDNHPGHTIYPDPACPNASCFDSPVLSTNDTYSFTFLLPGTWNYHNHTQAGRNGTITVTDANAPDVVADLVASGPTSSTINLTWTSPGDDVGSTANFGTPTSYEIRYSTSTITEGNWTSATVVSDTPTVQAVDSVESVTVTGLTSETAYYFAFKTSDEIPNVSALSNVSTATTTVIPPDATPPEDVTDLILSDATLSSIKLSWTAPGDDGSSGTAASYDVRYSTSSITEGNWASATPVSSEPTPSSAGSAETMTISALDQATTYYFALKTSDEAPNVSGLSNVPSLATLSPGGGGGGSGTISDFIPPSDITDLTVRVTSATSVELAWTAPGDDEDEGTAATYDIRYSKDILTPSTFSFATQIKSEPTPQAAGSKETFAISGLETFMIYHFAIKASDENLNETRISNIATVTVIPGDTTTPEAISDLTFTNPSITSAELTWTAPGDDGDEGTAATYDIRHSPEAISEDNWQAATKFLVDMSPQIAGTAQSMLIPGFDHETTYYIALKTFDEAGNESALSNVITFTTPPEPISEEESSPPTPPSVFVSSIYDESSLIRALGDDKVYLIRDGALLWIPTSEAFFAGGHDWNNIQTVNASEIVVTKSATLVRAEGAPEVYALHGDTRRHIPTLEAFENEGHAWDAIITLSERELAWYSVLSLAKAVDDPKVFLLDGATKQWIFTAEVFISHGYDWNDIIEVESVVLDSYTSTGALTE